jgi:hypothetical protein
MPKGITPGIVCPPAPDATAVNSTSHMSGFVLKEDAKNNFRKKRKGYATKTEKL